MKKRRTPMRERACTIFANRLLKWMEQEIDSKEEDHIFYRDYCLQKGLDLITLEKLRQQYPHFDAVMKFAEDIQEMKLNKMLLSHGKFSGASFLLKAHHGYGEKSEGEKPIAAQSTLDSRTLETATDDELREIIHRLTHADD
jgi:hypothetical protein